MWAVALTVPILNAADLGMYAYDYMELNHAAQTGAQAAFKLCNPAMGNYLPAATKCPNVLSTVTTAAQSTSLGSKVIIGTFSQEGNFCQNGSSLHLVGTSGTLSPALAPVAPSPNDCTTIDPSMSYAPSDYVEVIVRYTYTPVFGGVSIGSLLPSPIKQTAWMRLQ